MVNVKELGKLNIPTPKDEIKYRPGGTFDMKNKNNEVVRHCRMLAYVDARYVQDKLDEIVGTANWSNKFHRDEKGILFCTITITFERKEGVIDTISKTDCGTESNVEQQKGEVSDSFKRCAVHYGLARDLYSLPDPFRYVAEMKGKKIFDRNVGRFVFPTQWKPEGDK